MFSFYQEVALNYGEVLKRLERSISALKRMSTLFLATITGNTTTSTSY
jgi:hypothetical protein